MNDRVQLKIKTFLYAVVFLFFFTENQAQNKQELNEGWVCRRVGEVNQSGESISNPDFTLKNWMPAEVPGTVLTTLLKNDLIPDPLVGLNNEKIPDIYETGNDHYTYWFVKDLEKADPAENEQIWLRFRGINYGCDVFFNGKKLNKERHHGMFLRQQYNITQHVRADGRNRLAVIVFPPDPPGNPNGGQGGDGVIGRNVCHQYVAGWDWIQPVRDRNTGIWDKVFIERTGLINIKNPHVITRVPGKRTPEATGQEPVILRVTAELENPSNDDITGTIQYEIAEEVNTIDVLIPANSTFMVVFPDLAFPDPALWWPNGYGPQNLYDLKLDFITRDQNISDSEMIKVGMREIKTEWNRFTRSRQVFVNGQKIFIKGGNWIISDAMLRFSKERYDAEIRFHRDMNLNLIRIWGGAITERPEFYAACDKYGLLVMQDFWMSGDCNGRWVDPRKKDDQWTRRSYPDDHRLFLRSAVDMVKMIRNHSSLAFWCGGNEIGPPDDLVTIMRDTLQSGLDGTRFFFESSTSGEMSHNFKGGTGDGPYGIQPLEVFWGERTFPFNSEIGSVGLGDIHSLQRFIPDTSLVAPGHYQSPDKEDDGRLAKIEPMWRYHKYIGYGNFMDQYGGYTDAADFAKKAQLINYNQYRALIEGFSSHMWEWYTGVIIWKTQNPWTALRGQMYDWYLDPNGGLYGLHTAGEPLHIMYDPVKQMIQIANHTFTRYRNLMVKVDVVDETGESRRIYQQLVDVEPTSVKNCQAVRSGIIRLTGEKGAFLSMKIFEATDSILSENLYWLPDSAGNYTFLQDLPKVKITSKVELIKEGKLKLHLENSIGNPVAFFIRISMIDKNTGKRILPVFYSDNYISILPGSNKSIYLEYPGIINEHEAALNISGWNVENRNIELR